MISSQAVWGLLGVIVGSLLSTVKDLFLDWTRRKRNQRYAAVRLVSLLDVFVDRCRDVAFDEGEMEFEGNERPVMTISIVAPQSPEFPQDIDWQSLDPQLVYRILALPAQISEANAAIRDASEHAGPPDYEEAFEERQYRYAKLGLMAMAIANDLRRENKLTARTSEAEEWSSAVALPVIEKRIREKWAKSRIAGFEESDTAS